MSCRPVRDCLCCIKCVFLHTNVYLYSKPNCICCALNEGQIGVVGEVDAALYVLSASTGPHLLFIIIIIIVGSIIIITIIITLDVALYVLSASARPHLVLSKLMEHCFSRNITTLTSDQGYYSSKVETSIKLRFCRFHPHFFPRPVGFLTCGGV